MNGFYSVHFTGPTGPGDGVVLLLDGNLYGGDSGYIYTGTYTLEGNALRAQVQVQQVVPGIPSVFGAFGNLTLSLSGNRAGEVVEGSGNPIGNPHVRMGFRLQRRAHLPASGQRP